MTYNTEPFKYRRERGVTYYELSNHLGNVLVTVTDMKVGIEGGDPWVAEYYEATVVSAIDYYPFGSAMAGRKYNDDSYRYGFNGMEKDDEMKGNGNSYDFGARLYDSRVGRWLSLDPLAAKYPNLSPYNFTGNNPVLFVDYDGRDFGLKINYKTKTVTFVQDFYSLNAETHKQLKESLKFYNNFSQKTDEGWTVNYELKAIKPKYNKEDMASIPNRQGFSERGYSTAEIIMFVNYENYMKEKLFNDNKGTKNLYMGDNNAKGEKVIERIGFTGDAVGGHTEKGNLITMKIHEIEKRSPDGTSTTTTIKNVNSIITISHEVGHTLGLDDNPYKSSGTYYSDGGIMDYSVVGQDKIIEPTYNDIINMLNFSIDYLNGKVIDVTNVKPTATITEEKHKKEDEKSFNKLKFKKRKQNKNKK